MFCPLVRRPSAAALKLALPVFLISLQFAYANGFRNPPAGARALGMDGGKIAFIDDATALDHNIANLVSLEEKELSLNVTLVMPDAEFTALNGDKAKVDDDAILLPNLYFAYPLSDAEDGITMGLGITTPYGQSTEWDKDASFRYSAPYSAQLAVVDIRPAVAARLGPAVSVGAALDIYYSELEFDQVFPWSAVLGAPVPDGEAGFEGDGWGLGASLAVTWQVAEKQRLAATYRSAFSVDYEGDFNLKGAPGPAAAMFPSSDFNSKIKFPNWVTLGYGIQVSEQVKLGVDVEWIQFSRYEELKLDIGSYNGSGIAPPTLEQDWKDIWTAGLGMEWMFTQVNALWLSYKYMESPIPDETFSPTIVDADKHGLGIGLGHRQGSHHLAASYQVNLLDDRTITSNPNPALNGTYEATSHLVALTYAYNF